MGPVREKRYGARCGRSAGPARFPVCSPYGKYTGPLRVPVPPIVGRAVLVLPRTGIFTGKKAAGWGGRERD